MTVQGQKVWTNNLRHELQQPRSFFRRLLSQSGAGPGGGEVAPTTAPGVTRRTTSVEQLPPPTKTTPTIDAARTR